MKFYTHPFYNGGFGQNARCLAVSHWDKLSARMSGCAVSTSIATLLHHGALCLLFAGKGSTVSHQFCTIFLSGLDWISAAVTPTWSSYPTVLKDAISTAEGVNSLWHINVSKFHGKLWYTSVQVMSDCHLKHQSQKKKKRKCSQNFFLNN